ncbi:hypothetical protein D3C76_858520 [compost metagenome]
MPAAEEQGHQQRRDQDDADVLTDEEHAPFHAGIFNVVTVGQFLFRFRLVERVTVSHGDASDEEGQETEDLRNDEPQVLRLVFNDVAHVEGTDLGHDAHQRQGQEHLVGDGLGRGAQAAEQGELVVARPAGEQHGVHRQAGHGEEEQDADVQVRHTPVRGDRNDGEGDQQGAHGDHGCQGEDHLVGERRSPVFLEEHLDHVRAELEGAERADPVGTVAVLPEAEQTTLDPAQQRAADDHGEQDDDGLDDLDEDVEHSGCQPTHWAASCRPSATQPTTAAGIPCRPTGRATRPAPSSSLTRSGRRSS